MGKVICIGLGPGDPELMSVKAHRLLTGAQHVAFFRKPGRRGQARTIVDGIMAETAVEHAMEYPVTTEIHFSDPEYNRLLSAFYDDWADRLTDLAQTEDVIVMCEGIRSFTGRSCICTVAFKVAPRSRSCPASPACQAAGPRRGIRSPGAMMC